jgi:succinoglycan biosynthesis transport protein ExoP
MQTAPYNQPAMANWSVTFFTRLHRYQSLFRRRWWVLLLAIAVAFGIQAVRVYLAPPSYQSSGRMWVQGKMQLPEGSLYSEEWSNFIGTQIELMKSPDVQSRARDRVQALQPELKPAPVQLEAMQAPRASIFILTARGTEAAYTQAYLDAVMQSYIEMRRGKRSESSEATLMALTQELQRTEKDLQDGEDGLLEFQKENNVVLLQEQGNSAATYLATLNSKLASLKTESELLNLLSLDQNLERQQKKSGEPSVPGGDPLMSGPGPELEYLKERQQIQIMRADLAEKSMIFKPRHPKIIEMKEEIARRERLLDIYKQQSQEQLESRRASVKIEIQNLENTIKEWEPRALDLGRRLAEYRRMQGKVARAQSTYEMLRERVKSVDMSKSLDQDVVSILDKASPSISIKLGVAKQLVMGGIGGLFLGLLVLFLLDRIDDRVNSFTELRDHFEESVLGQIPMDRPDVSTGRVPLLKEDDPRQMYAEAFRNIRSSLLYLEVDGPRPKTLLVTSAVPNEGKSTVAANLAVTLAFAGSRTLLVDCDLRRGLVAQQFGLHASHGLADVLQQKMPWTQALVPSGYPNLTLLPRGKAPSQPGELLLSSRTELFLKEIYDQYDYIIFDSAPVLATDDTTSLAPKIEGTLFVMRASYTSARLTRNALDLLYQRQVGVLGMIFNAVNTSLPEYYYYQYREYYSPTAAG